MEFVERSQSSNKRGSISTGANSTVPSWQAYVDLLKASWILYDIVLEGDNRNALQSNENRKLFINLSDVRLELVCFELIGHAYKRVGYK